MARISQQAKENLVKKALSNKHQSVREIAKQNNVGYSSLQKWIRGHQVGQLNPKNKHFLLTAQLARSAQLGHLLATANLDDIALGAYCRRHGLYSFQLQQWKDEYMTQDIMKKTKKSQLKQTETENELKALKLENKRLRKEIKTKEFELAETKILLKFKKKIDSFLKGRKGD